MTPRNRHAWVRCPVCRADTVAVTTFAGAVEQLSELSQDVVAARLEQVRRSGVVDRGVLDLLDETSGLLSGVWAEAHRLGYGVAGSADVRALCRVTAAIGVVSAGPVAPLGFGSQAGDWWRWATVACLHRELDAVSSVGRLSAGVASAVLGARGVLDRLALCEHSVFVPAVADLALRAAMSSDEVCAPWCWRDDPGVMFDALDGPVSPVWSSAVERVAGEALVPLVRVLSVVFANPPWSVMVASLRAGWLPNHVALLPESLAEVALSTMAGVARLPLPGVTTATDGRLVLSPAGLDVEPVFDVRSPVELLSLLDVMRGLWVPSDVESMLFDPLEALRVAADVLAEPAGVSG